MQLYLNEIIKLSRKIKEKNDNMGRNTFNENKKVY